MLSRVFEQQLVRRLGVCRRVVTIESGDKGMKLYGSLTSPYVRKARVLIREKNLACEFVVADAWAADSPIPALNPLGKVPVLVLDNGKTLFDSPVIVEYLDSLKTPPLLATSGETRWQMLCWTALADGMLDAVVRSEER